MNAVEIEEAISLLAEQDFDSATFPYAFLEAFGNKPATIKRLKNGNTNSSDIDGGVLQRNNIHIAVCDEGEVSETLTQLKESPATERNKAKFVLVTDGTLLEAENMNSGETLACTYQDTAKHFSFFLALAGISYTKDLKDTELDRNASRRLQKLYIELLSQNPDWGTSERRHDMNHFMSRLIFCFFAEDTDIFRESNLFTSTVEKMSAKDSSNTHEVISECFRAMNTKSEDHQKEKIRSWADSFPYVNGGLFSGSTEVPCFSKIARSYLLHVGRLDWKQINPDIFGSMIQAIADDEERGALGMHYTSVPNILKVLNPLFLDDLRRQLKQAKESPRKLLNLRKRLSNIRVFDPACGSGNFLVIAYKQMREIEAEINACRNEYGRHSDISLKNFRGIELRDFPAEIARLALIIAEYQCDVVYRGQKLALAEFLPLDTENWITCANALEINWLSACPPTGKTVTLAGDDLFSAPMEQAQVDFENEGGETYICGNPPYLGSSLQTEDQKADLKRIFGQKLNSWKSLDYVSGWFMKAAEYGKHADSACAFVSTNSICQGQQVPILWPLIFDAGQSILFAHTSFKWTNLATHNAGVIVVIVGITSRTSQRRNLFSETENGELVVRRSDNINPYLVPSSNVYVTSCSKPINGLSPMDYGSKPADGGNLILSRDEMSILEESSDVSAFILPYVGSTEFIGGKQRFCLWIDESNKDRAYRIPEIQERIIKVKSFREKSSKKPTREAASHSHRFVEVRYGRQTGGFSPLIVPIHTSENREYLPVGVLSDRAVVSNAAFAIYDAPLWTMSVIASRLHLTWIASVCGKIKTDFRYSNKIGWNTFPIDKMTQKNKEDLTKCAKDILLAREAHFPATIADLYDPEKMPEDLRRAHERNDEVLERIYIGRRFKNDTERLEKLFELYIKMTKATSKPKKAS